MEKVRKSPRTPKAPVSKAKTVSNQLMCATVQTTGWGEAAMALLHHKNTTESFEIRIGLPKSYRKRVFHGAHRAGHAKSMYLYLLPRTPISDLDLIRTGFR